MCLCKCMCMYVCVPGDSVASCDSSTFTVLVTVSPLKMLTYSILNNCFYLHCIWNMCAWMDVNVCIQQIGVGLVGGQVWRCNMHLCVYFCLCMCVCLEKMCVFM